MSTGLHSDIATIAGREFNLLQVSRTEPYLKDIMCHLRNIIVDYVYRVRRAATKFSERRNGARLASCRPPMRQQTTAQHMFAVALNFKIVHSSSNSLSYS